MKISRRTMLASAASLPALSFLDAAANAQPAYTPDDLKSTLTPLGGLRAGNAEGTIPAWTGEVPALPAGWESGMRRPDPFAGDAAVATINAANMAQYQDKLPAGVIQLLKLHSDCEIQVFPTHRTGVAPQYVYDYVYKNATSAQLSPDGNNLSGAYGGIPFPIPTNGKQVIWNHLLRWFGATIKAAGGTWQITSSGEVILRAFTKAKYQVPYYFEGREADFNGIYEQFLVQDIAPAYAEGQEALVLTSLNPLEEPNKAYEYLLGERRVRLAPQLNYDTPVDLAGGIVNWDEGAMFNGALNDYDCTIVGKKEIYVPYNCNKAWNTPATDVMGPKFVNNGVIRYELHRVWVVEMTLAPGMRNVDARRTVYVDEDTWLALAIDIYDSSGSLWKHQYAVAAICSDIPAMCSGFYFIMHDFHSGSYVNFGGVDLVRNPDSWYVTPELPSSFFTPGELSALAGGN